MRVQVTLIHVCGMTGEEVGEGGGAAPALLRALPCACSVSSLPVSGGWGEELPLVPPSGSCECHLSVLQHILGMHPKKGFMAKYI